MNKHAESCAICREAADVARWEQELRGEQHVEPSARLDWRAVAFYAGCAIFCAAVWAVIAYVAVRLWS